MHGCLLAQRESKVDVACFGDPAREVGLARLVARRRPAGPRPDLPRGCGAGGIIDSKSIGQRHDGADPGHRYQPTTNRILLGELTDRTFKSRPCPAHMICVTAPNSIQARPRPAVRSAPAHTSIVKHRVFAACSVVLSAFSPLLHSGAELYSLGVDQTCPSSREITARHHAKHAAHCTGQAKS